MNIAQFQQKFAAYTKPKEEVKPSKTDFSSRFNSYKDSVIAKTRDLTEELHSLQSKKVQVDTKPIHERFTNFYAGFKDYAKSVDTSGIANRFKNYWDTEVKETNSFYENAQKQGINIALPGFTSLEDKRTKLDKISSLKPLGVPVGSTLAFFQDEPDALTLSREKLVKGETLNPREKQLLNQEGFDLVAGMASPLESKIPTKQIQQEALQKMDYLMNGAEKLRRMGFSKQQAFEVKFPQYRQLLNNFTTVTNPKAKPVFDDLFAKWIGKREAATTIGLEYGKTLKEIPEDIGMTVIHKIENPSIKVAPEVEKIAANVKKMYDTLHTQTKLLGLDVGYLDNYVFHAWQESPEEVAIKFKALGKKFSGKRSIPTYAEGISLGLTPKYTNPSQLVALYSGKMQQVVTNLEFFNGLKKEGLVANVSDGIANGWTPITAPGFPQSVVKTKTGEVLKGSYYAQPEIAQLVNRIFSPQPESTSTKVLGFIGSLNKNLQNISLSGGLPKTPINSFALLAGLQKEYLSGNFINPTVDFLRSFGLKQSIRFFEENTDVIKRMQVNNIPLQTEFDMASIVKRDGVRGWLKTELGTNAGEIWSSTLENPTFKRFLPMLQINTFKSIEKAALKKGLSESEASVVAANAVKNFYGTVGSDVLARRSKVGEDITSSFLFAPRYRESLIYFWKNVLQSVSPVNFDFQQKGLAKLIPHLNNPISLENQFQTRFAVGAALAYVSMDALNERLNGHPLRENPPGKEMTLLIPAGDVTIGIPWLSSIGFLPRTTYETASAAARGDFAEVGNKLKGFTSMGLRGGLDILSNQNYYGESITSPNDTTSQKYAKVAYYLAEQYSHPFLRGFLPSLKSTLTGEKKDDSEIANLKLAAKTLELPVRFYETDKVNSSWYFDAEKEALKSLNKDELAVYKKLHKGKQVDEDGLPVFDTRSSMSDALDRLANPTVFNVEAEIAINNAEKTGEALNPLYELNQKQQEVVLVLKTLPPGDSNKSKIITANPWLKNYWLDRDAYVDDLKARGIIKGTIDDGKPQVSEDLQEKLNYYFTLPTGTGDKTDFLEENPEVKLYFDANRLYNNKKRLELGLPLLPDYESSGKNGKKKLSARVSEINESVLKFKPLDIDIPEIKPLPIRDFEPIRPTRQPRQLPERLKLSGINYKGKRSLSEF